jgi:hypothetical protein
VHRHDDCDSVRPAAGGKWCCCAWAAFNCRQMPAWKLAMGAQDITRGGRQQLRFVNGVQLHEYRCQGVQIRLRVTSKNGGGDLRLCCWSRFKVPFIGPSQASASAQDCSDNCPVPPNGERCVNNILDLRRSACAELASLRYVEPLQSIVAMMRTCAAAPRTLVCLFFQQSRHQRQHQHECLAEAASSTQRIIEPERYRPVTASPPGPVCSREVERPEKTASATGIPEHRGR